MTAATSAAALVLAFVPVTAVIAPAAAAAAAAAVAAAAAAASGAMAAEADARLLVSETPRSAQPYPAAVHGAGPTSIAWNGTEMGALHVNS